MWTTLCAGFVKGLASFRQFLMGRQSLASSVKVEDPGKTPLYTR